MISISSRLLVLLLSLSLSTLLGLQHIQVAAAIVPHPSSASAPRHNAYSSPLQLARQVRQPAWLHDASIRQARVSSSREAAGAAGRRGGNGGDDRDEQLIWALRNGGLNAFADLLVGRTDFICADGGEKVLLALTDSAVARLPSWIRNNTAVLEATLLQHTLVGSFPDLATNLSSSQSGRIHTIGYSMLSQGKYANLPGNNGQAVAMSSSYRPAIQPTRNGGGDDDEYASSNVDDTSYKGFLNEALNDNELRGDRIKVGPIMIVPVEHHITIPGPLRFTLNRIIGANMNQSSLLFNAETLQKMSARDHSRDDEDDQDDDGNGDDDNDEDDQADDGNGGDDDDNARDIETPRSQAVKDLVSIMPSAYPAALAARLNSLAQTPGITVFVPSADSMNDLLVSPTGRAILTGSDAHAPGGHDPVGSLLALLGQHIIEARTLYSPLMRDLCDDSDAPPVTTSSGTLLSFTCAGGGRGGKYPTAVNLHRANDTALAQPIASAKFLQTDILFANGVAHVVDGVLFSLDSDASAAARARSTALRKASGDVQGPLSGGNSGDGGMQAGNPDGPNGVMRPPVGQINSTTGRGHTPKHSGASPARRLRPPSTSWLPFGAALGTGVAGFLAVVAVVG